ncbi:MAG: Sec-independent protein translocase subunit TatA [Pasteurellaceae bacterium]|nr:Sec-independent protein translocase subunit TatA [Pasteurellaceae bacterium]
MGGISIWQLVIVALIILLLFGTKKLRSLGSDLGESVKGFKKAMSDDKPQDAEFNQVEQKADTQAVRSDEQKAKEKEQA